VPLDSLQLLPVGPAGPNATAAPAQLTIWIPGPSWSD